MVHFWLLGGQVIVGGPLPHGHDMHGGRQEVQALSHQINFMVEWVSLYCCELYDSRSFFILQNSSPHMHQYMGKTFKCSLLLTNLTHNSPLLNFVEFHLFHMETLGRL